MAWKKQLLEGDLLTVRKNTGADVGTRKRLNFIEGSNITLAITDDAGDEEVDIQITGAAGGGIGTHGNEYHDPNMLPTAGGTHTGTLWMSNGALKDMLYIRSPSGNTLALSYGLSSKLTIESDKVKIWDDLISAYDNQDKLGDSTHTWKEFHATDIHAYGTLDMNGHPIIDIPTPTSGSHAANKSYVDAHNWGAGDITSGTFDADRVPVLPTDRYGSAVLVSGTRAMTGDLDFAKHQAKAMALECLGSAPASPATAQLYYNTGDDKVYVYVA